MDDFRRYEASEHYERAIALERAGRIDEAIIEYRRAVDADPGFAEAHEALGHHYWRRGLLTKALDAFRAVAHLEANYTNLFNLGHIMVELERYEEALEVFHQCLPLVPEDPATLYEIGYSYHALGRLPEALASLRVPQQVYPKDYRVNCLLGACYLGLEEWDEARKSYQQALEQAVSSDEACEAQAGLWIAQRYQELPLNRPLGLKERVYADSGIVILGTAGDDGLDIAPRVSEHFSLEAINTTILRLKALIGALEIDLSAVVAVDRASIPLAAVLGQALAVPRKRLSQLLQQDRVLLVLLDGRQPEFLQVAIEQAPDRALSFVMALGWYTRGVLVPDFIGVLMEGECSLPWGGHPDESEIEATVETLTAMSAHSSEEPNLESQIQFYTKQHPRLRFLE